MPDQDQDLQQALVQRNAFGQTLPLSEDDDYVGKGVQGLLGAIGLGDNKNRSNMIGQMLSSGLPTVAGIGALKMAPEAAEYLSDLRSMRQAKPAVGTLVSHLMNYRKDLPDFSKVPSGGVATHVPTPNMWRTMLSRTVSRVPEAEGMFQVPIKSVAREEGLHTAYNRQSALSDANLISPEEKLTRAITKGKYERPAITGGQSPEDAAAAALSPSPVRTLPNVSGMPIDEYQATMQGRLPDAPPPARTISVGPKTSIAANTQDISRKVKLNMLGIDEDGIRAIRNMPTDTAMKVYPKLTKDQLRRIRYRESFGWIE